jgi:ADP-heptose:LPS heptosyltransferase
LKVLIIRLSSIGDIVLTTPLLRCLKQQDDEIRIHYLVKEAYEEVLIQNPHISKLHLFKGNMPETIAELKREGFDYIFDLHKNIRSFRIKKALKKPSESFNKLNLQKYLRVRFKMDVLPEKHIVDRYFEALHFNGTQNDQAGLEYYLSESDEKSALAKIEAIGKSYYAFVLGATFFTKRYPANKVIELCKKIDKYIVLLGGKEDQAIGEEVAREAGSHVRNFCGQLSLNESAALIKHAEKVLTNDTGLMHIAAAFKKDCLVFWGNTIPEFGMYPYKTNHYNAQVEKLSCRPCSKLGYKSKCPKGHFKCMNDIDQERVLDWLSGKANPSKVS